MFFSNIRHRNYEGTVFNSGTGEPLDPAMVELLDVATGRVVATAITDLYGRFSFVVERGMYRINARKTGYIFPSWQLKQRGSSQYKNLYFGEVFPVYDKSSVITFNIPMDQVESDWNENAKKEILKSHLFKNLLNKIFRKRLWGHVAYKKSHLPASGMEIQIVDAGIRDSVVARAHTSADGKYFLHAPKGKYILKLVDPITGAVLKDINVRVGADNIVNLIIKI